MNHWKCLCDLCVLSPAACTVQLKIHNIRLISTWSRLGLLTARMLSVNIVLNIVIEKRKHCSQTEHGFLQVWMFQLMSSIDQMDVFSRCSPSVLYHRHQHGKTNLILFDPLNTQMWPAFIQWFCLHIKQTRQPNKHFRVVFNEGYIFKLLLLFFF